MLYSKGINKYETINKMIIGYANMNQEEQDVVCDYINANGVSLFFKYYINLDLREETKNKLMLLYTVLEKAAEEYDQGKR